MTERARHLAERVFPEGVRVRQWVLSLPFDLRWRAAFDHELARALARIAVDAIEERYRRLAAESGLCAPRGGSVVVMQRFGSDLRTNLHLHGLFLDGAYGEDEHGARRFARAAAPSPDDVEAILARIVTRARAWLEARDGEDALDDDELALAQSHHASSRPSGAEAHRPDDDLLEQGRLVLLPTRRKARINGFDLDAEVAVHEHERERLEYLCRYVLRPPLALDRLKILADDLVCIELKHPWRDGTTHVSMTPSVLLARLASLVPRPRVPELESAEAKRTQVRVAGRFQGGRRAARSAAESTPPSTSACSLRTRAIALTSRPRARPRPRAPKIRPGLR